MASNSVVEFRATEEFSSSVVSVENRRNPVAATVLSFDSRPRLQAGDMAYTFDGSVVGQELVQLIRPSKEHPDAWEVIAANAPLMCDDGIESWSAIVTAKCLRRAPNMLRPAGYPYV